MRLFVAVTMPAAVLADLAAAVDGVRTLPGAPRWGDPARWHLTLAFLGDVDEDRVEPVGSALRPVAATPGRFRLAVGGAGTFPERGRPRVLWVGLAGDLDMLTALAGDTADTARRAGVRLERRPFRPHLTLGRWRADDAASRTVAEALGTYRGPDFVVEELVLMRSHLGPRPRYEPVRRFPLGRARQRLDRP